MKKVSSVCDWCVIASGTSTTHIRAIADNIIEKLKEKRQRPWHVEGRGDASWMLLDFGDVVAHIFLKETREYYNLEELWKAAPQERYKEPRRKKKVPRRKKNVSRSHRKKSILHH